MWFDSPCCSQLAHENRHRKHGTSAILFGVIGGNYLLVCYSLGIEAGADHFVDTISADQLRFY